MKIVIFIQFISLFYTTGSIIAAENQEILYLLSFVTESNCTFVRNGKEYKADEAGKHLAMKYDRVQHRIKTAEDFITKIASKSSISGKEYLARCSNGQVTVTLWLTEALASHRISTQPPEYKK